METTTQAITLGPFRVAPDGLLAPLHASAKPSFRFAWRGRGVQAELDRDQLRMRATAARIPFTAERATDRPRAFGTLRGLPRDLPTGWNLTLAADHSIVLETARTVGGVATVTQLLTALVRFVLELDPYLDRLEAGGAWSAVTAAGNAKT
ncbi:MAG TPA: hypothetical protein VGM87_20125 [Roseomonas sp.]